MSALDVLMGNNGKKNVKENMPKEQNDTQDCMKGILCLLDRNEDKQMKRKEMIINRGLEEKHDYKNMFKKYTRKEFNKNDIQYNREKELLEVVIPSKDVKDYCKKTEFVFTDFIMAGLISHARMPYFRKIDELKNIRANSKDIELNNQLEEYIDFLEYTYKSFVCNDNGKYVYKLSPTERKDDEENYLFSSYEAAREYSLKLKNEKYEIIRTKVFMNATEIENDDCDMFCDEYAEAQYDQRGDLISCYSGEIPDPSDTDSAFYIAYVYIPFPFRDGDFVVDINDNILGMIIGVGNEEEMQKRYVKSEFLRDYTDYNICVESLREEKDEYDWAYDHCSPLNIVYAKNDFENAEHDSIELIMLQLRNVKRDRCTLFELEYTVKKYREKIRKNREKGKQKKEKRRF
ncbi:MAG: hypothetical protein K5776_00060 [Lachnospiraceae bacterium]|nr:hypothetical protein [Lachnospiraceae bacterium]